MEKYIDCSKKIGKGNFSNVKLVQRKHDQLFLAMKVIELETNDESLSEAVHNETLILQKLKHPNIVEFYEAFVNDDHLCLIMEYCKEGDLQQKIKETKSNDSSLPEALILEWFTQICLAIKYLYECKIIHRDIKVHNTFLSSSGIIKIGDFGISKQLEQSGDLASTQVGTPYYLTPEMCSNSTSSHKSDIWMLGCILYELCTLEKPFSGHNIQNVIYKILHEKPTPIPEQYSKFIKELLDQMLKKSPVERPNINDILLHPQLIEQMAKLRLKYPQIYSDIILISDEEHKEPELSKSQNAKEIYRLKPNELPSLDLIEEKMTWNNKDRTISTKESSLSSIQSPTIKAQRKPNAIQNLIEQKRFLLGSNKISPTNTYSLLNRDQIISSPPQKSTSLPSAQENNYHEVLANKLNESSRKNQKLVISIPESSENQIKDKDEKCESNLQSNLSPNFQQNLIFTKSLQSRKKSSFSDQVFDPLSPGSPNRPFFAAQFLKSQLGEEKYENLKELIEKHNNPKRLMNEDSNLILEIIGEQNSTFLKTIEYLILKKSGSINGPQNYSGGQTFKSPASATSKFKQSFTSETNLDEMKQDTPKNKQSIWNPLNNKSKTQVPQNNKIDDIA